MKFGYFNDQNREYVITDPKTPIPWFNYLGTKKYFGLISNTAGGYTFYEDARYRRLLRYRYNNIPMDIGGRYLYIYDEVSKNFWSTSWQPTQTQVSKYECRHGLGYSQITILNESITSKIKYFIPIDDNVEIWRVSISNNDVNILNPPKELSIFSFVEFCLWDALDDATNFQRNLNIGEVEIDEATNTIFHISEYRERRNHFAFFSSSEKIVGFDTDREVFIGPYNSLSNPIVLQNGKSSNSHVHGWSPIGSHQLKIKLKPGETKEFCFLLGYFENPSNEKFDLPPSHKINKKYVNKIISKYQNLQNVDNAFDELNSYWTSILNKLQVVTPDEHTNRMVNIWNAYQCMVTFNLSRSASYFESGISRGIGFRDSNQDILGFVHMIPERAKERIIDLAATQMVNGGAYHQYQPLTKKGNNEIGNNFNDDPLWLILSVSAYLKETGDFPILNLLIEFENTSGTQLSLIDHLKKAADYIIHNLGPHNLPLIGRADWNDCLNLNCFSENPDQSFQTTQNTPGKIAESVFIGGLFVLASRELSDIYFQIQHPKEAEYYDIKAKEMSETILKFGWDGEWFLRAYDNSGKKIGSHECNEGRIYIEPQGICGMAGIGEKEGYTIKALESVNKYLSTNHGIMLLDPPYSKYYLEKGEISSYPPGYKENGSVFCHTNPWIIIAEVKSGRKETAFNYYQRINPSFRENIGELHKCEPYVYAQMIAGKYAFQIGEAKNSWLTGTAAWNYVAINQWILGIRPTFRGLCIDPQIPSDWNNCTVNRIFRGKKYKITIQNSKTTKERGIWVNNAHIEGKIIPFPEENEKELNITVLI